jgi:hypothetical protein
MTLEVVGIVVKLVEPLKRPSDKRNLGDLRSEGIYKTDQFFSVQKLRVLKDTLHYREEGIEFAPFLQNEVASLRLSYTMLCFR